MRICRTLHLTKEWTVNIKGANLPTCA